VEFRLDDGQFRETTLDRCCGGFFLTGLIQQSQLHLSLWQLHVNRQQVNSIVVRCDKLVIQSPLADSSVWVDLTVTQMKSHFSLNATKLYSQKFEAEDTRE